MHSSEALSRALDGLYGSNRRQLFACALAVTGCPDRAEDAMQEAFYRLYRLDHIPENLKGYVFRAVRNAAINQLRSSRASAQRLTGDIFDNGGEPGELAARKEFGKRAADALGTISKDERETILEHLYADLTFREISELHDVPLGTVVTWYRRGLEKLRAVLKEE